MALRDRLKGLVGRSQGDKARPAGLDRRHSKRVKLPIPVQVGTAESDFQTQRLIDVSLESLCVQAPAGALRGTEVRVRFDGYPEVCEPFVLVGCGVREVDSEPRALAIEIDRAATSPTALRQFRKLVLHYLRHKPLLEDLSRGYLEGRCPACGWIGRVGVKTMNCSLCGERVLPVADSSSP